MALKRLCLTNSDETAIVDADDYESLKQYSWFLSKGGYVVRGEYDPNTKKTTTIYLHKEIVPTSKEQVCDHIDRNKLNNSKSNLRVASVRENLCNRAKYLRKGEATSRYKGVVAEKGKWRACITVNGRTKRLGNFNTEDEAGLAYNLACVKYHKEYAVLNDVPKNTTLPIKYKGVSYDSNRDKWISRLMIKGELVHYKRCNTQKEAVEARNEALLAYGKETQQWRGEN